MAVTLVSKRPQWLLLALSLALAGGCRGSSGGGPTTSTSGRPNTTIAVDPDQAAPSSAAQPVVEALGCTRTVDTQIGDGGGSLKWLAQSLDCYEGSRLLARIETFRREVPESEFLTAVRGRYGLRGAQLPAGENQCEVQSPGVVVGDFWIVTVPSEGQAPATAEATGGTVLEPLEASGPLVSFPPFPCTDGDTAGD